MTPAPVREPWSEALCAELVAAHGQREGALLPLLHAIQGAFGCVPEAAVPIVAEALNLSRAEVHGVVSFYHDFRRVPPGARVIKLCQAEACQARGVRALTVETEARLGVKLGETRADGALTFEPVYCLGLCASGPSALVDGRPVGRLDGDKLARLAAEGVR